MNKSVPFFLLIVILVLCFFSVKEIFNLPQLEYKITKEVCFNQLQQKSSEQIYLPPLDSENFYDGNITYKILDYILVEDEALYHFCAKKINEVPISVFLGYYEVYPTDENSINMGVYNSTVSCDYVFYNLYKDIYLEGTYTARYDFEEYNRYFQNHLFNASKIDYQNEEYFSRISNGNYWYSVKLDISYPIKEVTLCGTQEVEEIEYITFRENCQFENCYSLLYLEKTHGERYALYYATQNHFNNPEELLSFCEKNSDITVENSLYGEVYTEFRNEFCKTKMVISNKELTKELLDKNCKTNFTDWDCHKCGDGECCSSSPIYKCGEYTVRLK